MCAGGPCLIPGADKLDSGFHPSGVGKMWSSLYVAGWPLHEQAKSGHQDTANANGLQTFDRLPSILVINVILRWILMKLRIFQVHKNCSKSTLGAVCSWSKLYQTFSTYLITQHNWFILWLFLCMQGLVSVGCVVFGQCWLCGVLIGCFLNCWYIICL